MACRGCSDPRIVVLVGVVAFINFNYCGFYFSASLYFYHFMHSFQATKAATALIFSLMLGSFYTAGLVSGPLIMRFSARIVAIVGSILTCLGLALSAFSSSLYMLYFSFGILTGFNLGFLMMSGNVNVQQHTSRWRALASGVAFAGASLGGLCYPFIVSWTEAMYGWRGSLLIMGGLQLNCLPAGLLLLPVAKESEAESHKTEVEQIHTVKALNSQDDDVGELTNCDQLLDNNLKHREIYNNSIDDGNAGSDEKGNEVQYQKKEDISVGLCLKLSSLIQTLQSGGWASIICIVASICRITGITVIYSSIPMRVTAAGLPSKMAANLVSVVSTGELFGRLVAGGVASFHDRLPVILFIVAALFGGILDAIFGLAHTVTALTVTGAALGVTFGVMITLNGPVIRDTVGLTNFPWVFGLCSGAAGISYIPIYQFLVWVWVRTGDITLIFIIAGVFLAGTGFAFILYTCLARRPKSDDLSEISC